MKNKTNFCLPLTIDSFSSIITGTTKIKLDNDLIDTVEKSHNYLKEYSKDKVIYGINTGLGPMAQYKIPNDKLLDLQYNLIRSHSAGAGQPLSDECVKAAMLVRLSAISQGKSGIDKSTVELLCTFINKGIYPIIPEHGGVGASGDLVQLSHLALALIGEGEVTYEGVRRPTAEVLSELNISPINVKMREGLSLINGTSVMTGIGALNVIYARRLFNWSMLASTLLNEIVSSFDDHFSIELNQVKRHPGQQHVAGMMRNILTDSKMIGRRIDHTFSHPDEEVVFKKKVQEYYSLRCIPQIMGPVYDTIEAAAKVVENEMNSVSDNPIVDMEADCVFHGGNFHGDYISLEMDKLKLSVTRMSMLAERQLAFIFNNKLNEVVPHFVNLGTLGLNLGMQGVQFTATSTTAENQTLSNSMYVHSISNNNDNQDIVSMGTNSALMTKKVIENTSQVQAIQLMALLQAVDYLEIQEKLSTPTRAMYEELRALVPVFIEDTPKYKEIETLTNHIFTTNPNMPE